jgi:hypothetical protein
MRLSHRHYTRSRVRRASHGNDSITPATVRSLNDPGRRRVTYLADEDSGARMPRRVTIPRIRLGPSTDTTAATSVPLWSMRRRDSSAGRSLGSRRSTGRARSATRS